MSSSLDEDEKHLRQAADVKDPKAVGYQKSRSLPSWLGKVNGYFSLQHHKQVKSETSLTLVGLGSTALAAAVTLPR